HLLIDEHVPLGSTVLYTERMAHWRRQFQSQYQRREILWLTLTSCHVVSIWLEVSHSRATAPYLPWQVRCCATTCSVCRMVRPLSALAGLVGRAGLFLLCRSSSSRPFWAEGAAPTALFRCCGFALASRLRASSPRRSGIVPQRLSRTPSSHVSN